MGEVKEISSDFFNTTDRSFQIGECFRRTENILNIYATKKIPSLIVSSSAINKKIEITKKTSKINSKLTKKTRKYNKLKILKE